MTLSLCCSQGKLDEALEFFEKALAIFMKVNGDSSVEVATTLNNMAGVYQDQVLCRCHPPPRPGVLELLAAYLSC